MFLFITLSYFQYRIVSYEGQLEELKNITTLFQKYYGLNFVNL